MEDEIIEKICELKSRKDYHKNKELSLKIESNKIGNHHLIKIDKGEINALISYNQESVNNIDKEIQRLFTENSK